jgi:acyl-coenzyme A thioesterase PaaI-like protein
MSPENFYGLPDLPFNIHLGMQFERRALGGDATLRLPLDECLLDANVSVHRSAVYTLGEVAAAVCVLDALGPAMPVFLLTVAGEFRPVAPARGTVWTSAEVAGEPADWLESLRTKRKVQVAGKVSIFDEDGRVAAEMSATYLARKLSGALASALLVDRA